MPGRVTLGSTCALAQTWLGNEKVKLLNLQCLVINPFFSVKSISICRLLYCLCTSNHPTHKHAHTCFFYFFCSSAVRNRIQMLSFDCLSPRELNGVADLYQIECEMTSNLTLNYESHAGPGSFSPVTSCTLFQHEWPLTPILSCIQAENMSRLLILLAAFLLPPPLLLRDLL